MTDLKNIFSNDYPGIDTLFNVLIKPIFAKAQDLTLTTEQELSDTDKKQIKSFKIFAQVRGGFPVTFADVELQDSVALKRSRVNIQNCVRKIMQDNSNAIIFFHFTDNQSEWRISYVNKGETLKNCTNPKRYTYLCGAEHSCRTITERFQELKNISGTIKASDMINAFSVEPISNDFFDQYKEIYANLVEYISGKRFVKKGGKFVEEKTKNANPAFSKTFDGDDKLVRDYVKKLMGRLVFLQFLQKKGWLGVKEGEAWGSGDKNFLYNLFNKANDNIQKDFLESALEPLFFKTLNVERGSQNDLAPKELCDIYGTPIRIPYLNGGLFEEDEVDKKKVKFKAEHFREIFDFFNQYNFTIDETDSDEKELGVDPEMLGKIFENLLEDNKDKGAFYTPKEIVQYMCQESLIAYLTTCVMKKQGDNHKPEEEISESVRQMLSSPEEIIPRMNAEQRADFDAYIRNVKICDPAIGSGAFPMGMLSELFRCRVCLDAWAKNAYGETLPGDYAALKAEIIQNNIYGVDIENGAIDIARLRFWLSIIVDEQTPHALPNFDYKFIQGNSLIPTFAGEYINLDTREQKHVNVQDMKEVKKKILAFKRDFYTSSGDKKHQLNIRIKDHILQLISYQLGYEIKSWVDSHNTTKSLFPEYEDVSMKDAIERLPAERRRIVELGKKLRAQLADTTVSEEQRSQLDIQFFDWRMMFTEVFDAENGGFDIVIGNPPYIKEYENKDAFNGFRETSPYYMGKMDLWYGFACHGLELLCKNGHLCFIAQNNWTTSAGAKKFRNKVINDAKICQMIDFNSYMVFESASIQTMIMLFENNSKNDDYTIDYRMLETNSTKQDMIDLLEKKQTEKTIYQKPVLTRKKYLNNFIVFSEKEDLLQKIATDKSCFLEDEATNGIHTHHDCVSKKINLEFPDLPIGKGIFILTNEELKNLNLEKEENSLIKPFYESEEISKYFTSKKNKKWIIYTDSTFKDVEKMKKFPNVKKHLDTVKKAITSDNKPYGLHRARKEKFFVGEKIISQRKCVGSPVFSYSDFDCYVPAMYYVIQTTRWDMKFLTGVLNSKLIAFWLKN